LKSDVEEDVDAHLDAADDSSFEEVRGARAYPPSVQPGIPKLGRKPKGWTRAPIGEFLEPVFRPAQLVDDERYQLVTAKRSRGGIVPREVLFGRDIRTKTQFFVESGDFLISKRQISHGACGIVPEALNGAVVSNEYVALRPKAGLDLRFLSHLSHSVYFQQTCFHSSIGVHVEKLVFKIEDWLEWEFDIPPLEEQEQIVFGLDGWDRAVELSACRLQSKERFLNKLIYQLAQNNWVPVALDDVGKWVGGGTPSKTITSYWQGDIPWVSPKDMGSWRIDRAEDHISEEAVAKSSTKIVPAGSVLVVTRSGILRNTVPSAVAAVPVAINQDIKALQVDGPWSGSLIALIMRQASEQIRQACVKTGTTVESIDLDALKATPIALPDSTDAITQAEAVVVGLAREIDLLTAQLRELRIQKRGLLKRVFSEDTAEQEGTE
jgi:type I restriction enzyme S subunit